MLDAPSTLKTLLGQQPANATTLRTRFDMMGRMPAPSFFSSISDLASFSASVAR